MPRAEDYWPDFPVILGFGTTHEMRDAADSTTRSRLWDLKSPSKAACTAYDKSSPANKGRAIGFGKR